MSQATLSECPYVNSNLFASHYLDERVEERDEWDCDDAAREKMEKLQTLYQLEGSLVEAYGEDALIDNWIDEVLDVLGFGTQEEVTLPDGGGFVDELLFKSPKARRDAAKVYLQTGDTTDLSNRGIGIVEAKQWDAAFNERFDEQRPYRNASHQTKHYLEKTTENIQWGVLTNGRKWRLYGTNDYETQTYYEVDLPELIERGDLDAFKYFYVFFRSDAFHSSNEKTFHDKVWSESETASQELGDNLQDNVFTALRVLGRGFVESNEDLNIDPNDEEALSKLKEQSLVFLYRLMFVLYAESRGLIHPKDRAAQDEYDQNFSLDELRLEIHDSIGGVDKGFDDEFSDYSTTMWSRLQDLFDLIDKGEENLGIPPYNGGLFDHDEHDFLIEHEISNQYLAEVIYRLSTTENNQGKYVLADYADLDTRHLGSVYEGLLEHQFQIAPEQYAAVTEDGSQVWKAATEVSVADAIETVPRGGLYVVNDEGERKVTGAYYTPDYVVSYIVEETIDPLVKEIKDELICQDFEPGTQEYIGPFLQRATDLRILDPAMGSGHFLTKATGYLSEQVMSEMRAVEEEMDFVFNERGVRREIAKECIYGVDLNEMAVELAKLSMWLETLALDRPLAFLDHHLKVGNSLIGSDIETIEELDSDASSDGSQSSLAEFGATREGTIERLMDIYSEFLTIENETVEDVKKMESKYAEIERDQLRQRLVAMSNVQTAEQFGVDVPSGAYEQMARALEDNAEWRNIKTNNWFTTAQQLADEREFFHWKLAFPEVFYSAGGQSTEDSGFDAVIGNPPYVSNWNLTESDPELVDAINTIYDDVAVGHWDLYVPFCRRSLTLLADGGRHSFITSNSISKEKYARNIREVMIEDYSIDALTTFDDPQVFSGVNRMVMIYIIQNKTPESSKFSVVEGSEVSFETIRELSQVSLKQFTDYSWRVDVAESDLNIKNKIESKGVRLGHLCWVNPGVVAHSASDSPLDFEKKDVIMDSKQEGAKRYVSGKGIQRHHIDWNEKFIDYSKYAEHFHRPKDPALFEPPKIMFSNISGANNRIKSVFDDSGYYTNHSINHATMWTDKTKKFSAPSDYSVHDNVNDFDLEFISGVVNSSLIAYYFAQFHATKSLQKDRTRMAPEQIRSLPVYDISGSSTPGHLKGKRGETLPLDAETREEAIHRLTQKIIELRQSRGDLNLDLLDYIQFESNGPDLTDIGVYQPPEGIGNTILTATKEEYGNIRIGTGRAERKDKSTVIIHVTARYKPDNEDAHETDRWGYTETEPMAAMRLTNLSEIEGDLVEHFVPVAIGKSSGFAGFRETATKTISLVDRLESITLPKLDTVADDLDRYREAVERAAELNEKIQRTDDQIDEIVYDLYELTEEEIKLVRKTVAGD